MMVDPRCIQYEGKLARAADGDLDGAELASLNEHLATCEACRQEMESQIESLGSLRSLRLAVLAQARPVASGSDGFGASEDFHARVMAAVEQAAPWTTRWNWKVWSWSLAPVAAALAIVTVVVITRQTPASTTSIDLSALASGSAANSPVSSALWSSSMSDTSLLSLMLTANADDALADHMADHVKEK